MDFYILRGEEEFIYAMLFALLHPANVKGKSEDIPLRLARAKAYSKWKYIESGQERAICSLNRIPDRKFIGKHNDIIGGCIGFLFNHFDQQSRRFFAHIKCRLGKG